MNKPVVVILSFVILSFTHSFAQGNLQFNQVKLVGSVETVPTGKVWKITSILPSARLTSTACSGSGGCGANSSTDQIITVNGTSVYMASSNSMGSYYAASASAMALSRDIWLPDGATLAAGTGVYMVSVIEFNIVP